MHSMDYARCPSVCPFVCLTYVTCRYSIETVKHIIKRVYHRVATHSSFPVPNGTTGWGKNRDFRPVLGFGIDDCWNVECSQQFRPWDKIYHSKRWRQSPCISEPCLWQQRLNVVSIARRVCIARTMPSQDVCLSVRLTVCSSVCLPVTRRYCVWTVIHILNLLNHLVASPS